MDTTVVVWANRQDPLTHIKIKQYIYKNYIPLNPVNVDSLFKFYLIEALLEVPESFVNYFDLENDSLISSSALRQNLKGFHIVTPMDTLDIINTIGVKAYVKAPPQVILKPVIGQIIIGTILNIIALVCVVLLILQIKNLYKEGYRILGTIAGYFRSELSEQKHLIEKLKENEDAERSLKALLDPGLLNKLYDKIHDPLNYSEKLALITDGKERKHVFYKKYVELMPLFFNLKKSYIQDTEKKKVDIGVWVKEDAVIYTDEIFFEKIIKELLDNSVRYSRGSVEIRIRIVQKEDKTIIDIADTGWGIPQNELSNVFRIAYKVQSHADALKDTSMGLGLSFVQTYVHALGGKVIIKSEVGVRTHITIVFPHSKEEIKGQIKYKKMMKKVRNKE